MSIARTIVRRADRQSLPFKVGTGITKATHANKGYAVILDVSKAVGKNEKATVVLSGTTAGAKIVGELLDVNDDTKECSVEVRDMLLRLNTAYDKANNGAVLGTSTTAGVVDVAAALDDGPILQGGFTESSVNYGRAQRF